MASEWAHATAQAFVLWTRVRGSGLRGGRAAFVDGEMGRRGGLYTRGCSSKKVWPFYLYSLLVHRTNEDEVVVSKATQRVAWLVVLCMNTLSLRPERPAERETERGFPRGL